MTRTITGKVVSNKMDKTVVVAVERYKTHPIYKKRFKVTNKFKAHDETNTYKPGDMVEITETRPISREKHFEVTQLLNGQKEKK